MKQLAACITILALAFAGMVAIVAVSVGPAHRAERQVERALDHTLWTWSAADIINAKSRPTRASEETHFGQAVGTTTVNAGGDSAGTGWAESTYLEEYVQSMRIYNDDGAKLVCALVVARALSTDKCTTTCGAVGAGVLTCTGSGAADGTLIPPKGILVQSITGLDCMCLEASSASANVNATRDVRTPQ